MQYQLHLTIFNNVQDIDIEQVWCLSIILDS